MIQTHMDIQFVLLCVLRSHALGVNFDKVSGSYGGTRVFVPLLLRTGFSTLFSDNHAEAPPKVVAFLAAPRKQLLFRIPAQYGLGSPFDVMRTGGLRWSRKDRKYGTHRRR